MTISPQASASFVNVTFANGYAEDRHNIGGAALLVYGKITSIDECIFKLNRAASAANSSSSSGYARGGAISVLNKGIIDVIRNSNFTDNQAGTGGAIAVMCRTHHCSAKIGLVLGCTFISNHAYAWGGAIFVNNFANGISEVRGCHFEDNSIQYHNGGAISSQSSIIIKDSIFVRNYDTYFQGRGGALYFSGSHSQVTIQGCSFESNGGGNDPIFFGGAVAMVDTGCDTGCDIKQQSNASIAIIESNFSDNGFNKNGLGRDVYLFVNYALLYLNTFDASKAGAVASPIHYSCRDVDTKFLTKLRVDRADSLMCVPPPPNALPRTHGRWSWMRMHRRR